MKQSNMKLDREKQNLVSKVAEMEFLKSTTDQKVEEHRVQIIELEA